jgi:hypothetical protein
VSYPVVIIAGADQELFDALAGLSAKALAPNGVVVVKPTRDGLSQGHADALLAEARKKVKLLAETVAVNTIVLTICQPDGDRAFRQRFYPFALYRRVSPPDFSEARSRNARNRIQNAFLAQFQKTVVDLRQRAEVVKGVVSKANMSAFVLPVRNFRRKELGELLEDTFEKAGAVADLATLLRTNEQNFVKRVPMTTPPDSDRRCYSDGRHFFKSPGRDRHGYYKNAGDGDHQLTCLLNARSRLGGSLTHDFHFDCQPVRTLDADYPDCHDERREPKKAHVNIAPSDGII